MQETSASTTAHVEGQQHPIKVYLVVWAWLFILSTCSYLVDYFHLQGMTRWSLIIVFMMQQLPNSSDIGARVRTLVYQALLDSRFR